MFGTLLLYCFFLATVPALAETGGERQLSPEKSEIWGPGLKADVVLPARYFYIQAVDTSGNKRKGLPGESLSTRGAIH
uniref:Protein O-glucosyltransferase 2 n=1 Tax=Homo sapiens TaxID=9606 RepID=A0A9L9PX85_HUMAN